MPLPLDMGKFLIGATGVKMEHAELYIFMLSLIFAKAVIEKLLFVLFLFCKLCRNVHLLRH
jgi:hypothetical protein